MKVKSSHNFIFFKVISSSPPPQSCPILLLFARQQLLTCIPYLRRTGHLSGASLVVRSSWRSPDSRGYWREWPEADMLASYLLSSKHNYQVRINCMRCEIDTTLSENKYEVFVNTKKSNGKREKEEENTWLETPIEDEEIRKWIFLFRRRKNNIIIVHTLAHSQTNTRFSIDKLDLSPAIRAQSRSIK